MLMQFRKYRVIKESFNGKNKFYPQYAFKFLPFIWFSWQDDKIVFEEYINFITLHDAYLYITYKRNSARIIKPKVVRTIFLVND